MSSQEFMQKKMYASYNDNAHKIVEQAANKEMPTKILINLVMVSNNTKQPWMSTRHSTKPGIIQTKNLKESYKMLFARISTT